MRIALAGAGGTGKGTLGKILTDYYNIPFISSFIYDIGNMMGMKNYMDVGSQEKALAYQYSILFGQISQERAIEFVASDYISERSVYDYIPYFKDKGLTDEHYLDTIYKWGAAHYDAIIFLPVCFAPSDKETNTWRERDDEKRVKTSDIILNELKSNYNGKLLIMDKTNLDERVEYVKDFIGKL